MKNLRSASYFLELLKNKIPDILSLLEGDWISSIVELLLALEKAKAEKQVIDIANEIYEAGRRTKAKKIFNEIYNHALSKSQADESFEILDYEVDEPAGGTGDEMEEQGGIVRKRYERPNRRDNSSFSIKQVNANARKTLSKAQNLDVQKKSVKQKKSKIEKEFSRFANVGLFDSPKNSTEHNRKISLEKKTEYYLKINIGDDEDWDSEREESRTAFPGNELLPKPEPKVSGHWLDVVVTSHEFNIKKGHYKLFLPEVGNSWICDCKQDEEHHCNKKNREDYLHIPITTLSHVGEATLRIGFYFRNNLLQCRLFTAQVGKKPAKGKLGYKSVADYTLTQTLRDISIFQPRTINIFTNENADGSHRVVLVGVDGDKEEEEIVYHNVLGEDAVKGLLQESRNALHDTHRKLTQAATLNGLGEVVIEAKYDPLFSTIHGVAHAKNRNDFIADLKTLAQLGSQMWDALFNGLRASRKVLRKKLDHGKATIQIGHSRNDSDNHLFYPWSMLYDIDLDSNKPEDLVPCQLLNDWEPRTPLRESGTNDCPFKETHKINTVCPFGFWGFKHIIEQPPSVGKGHSLQTLQTEISMSSDRKLEMVMGYHNKLAWQDHLDKLKRNLNNVEILTESSKASLLNTLAQPELEFIYLFCHGRREKLQGKNLWMPYLEIGNDERITTGMLNLWRDKLPDNHWNLTKPLVFINGCHTAELTPDALANFVDTFIDANASGVVGTEVTIADTLASEIAELFFSYLLKKNATVGDAIRSIRFEFLSKGSVMGLAYTHYCSADLHLA